MCSSDLYFHALNQRMLHPLAPLQGRQVEILDAGCGTGGLIKALRARDQNWSLTGLDYSDVACDYARQRTSVPIVQGSIEALPFAAAQFDALLCADVISQIDDASVAIREFARVLRAGGILVINVAAYQWMWSYHDDSCQTKHRYTRPEIAALLRGAGFAGVRTTHWNALPFPAVWAKRKLLRSAADTSDVKDYPRAVDATFGALMAVEHAWFELGGTWAWGTSVFAVARKPGGLD